MNRGPLAEGEGVGLGPWVKEGDLDRAVGDRAGLAQELVHPLLGDRAGAVAVDVTAVGFAGRLPVEADPAPYRFVRCGRSHDQVDVTGVEPIGDEPVRLVQVLASSVTVQSPERAH